MRRNPQGDWRIEDLYSLARRYDIEYRQPGTSHVTFFCENGKSLTVPARKPIKVIYIKKFLEMLNTLEKEATND